MQEMEIIKRSRFQRLFPESALLGYGEHQGLPEEIRKSLEIYIDNYYYLPEFSKHYFDRLQDSQDFIKQNLMRYNNTRLQYLLTLYYYRRNCHMKYYIYIVYRSAYRIYRHCLSTTNYYIEPAYLEQPLLYQFLWTDIKDFFWTFHADFLLVNSHFTGNSADVYKAAEFCDSYFKRLSQKLPEKGKVSFEEVQEELERLLN
jgi:hypothetical protein